MGGYTDYPADVLTDLFNACGSCKTHTTEICTQIVYYSSRNVVCCVYVPVYCDSREVLRNYLESL